MKKAAFLLGLGMCSLFHSSFAQVAPSFFNGFYGGMGIGETTTYGTINSSMNAGGIVAAGRRTFVQSDNQHGRIQNNSFAGAFTAGYGHRVPNTLLYFASEVFVNVASKAGSIANVTGSTLYDATSSATIPVFTSTSSSYSKARLNNFEWGIDIRPGVLLTKSTLFYARFGAAFNKITLKNINSLGVTYPFGGVTSPTSSELKVQNSKMVAGVRLGLGLEHYLYKHVAATIDYIFTDYGTFSVNGRGNVNSLAFTLGGTFLVTAVNAFTNNMRSTLSNQQMFIGIKYYIDA